MTIKNLNCADGKIGRVNTDIGMGLTAASDYYDTNNGEDKNKSTSYKAAEYIYDVTTTLAVGCVSG